MRCNVCCENEGYCKCGTEKMEYEKKYADFDALISRIDDPLPNTPSEELKKLIRHIVARHSTATMAGPVVDAMGAMEELAVRLSAEREKERLVANRDVPTLFPTLQSEIKSLRATLAERDKELAEERADVQTIISPFLKRESELEAQLLAAQTVNGKLREALKRVDDLIIRRNESGIERFWDDLNGVKSFAKEALALSPDPTLLDEVKREKELIKDAEESLAAIDKAIAQLFWTSDDGSTQRDGTPEDGDAPPFITEAWKDIRSSLSRLRQSTHSGESHAD